MSIEKGTTPELRAGFETGLASLCLILTMLVALVGNVAVIAAISLHHSLRQELSNLLIINLSITDLISTLFIMLSAFVSIVMDEWPFGQFWCNCACALNYCLIIVSMLTLCFISIDRYQAVMHPLSYESRITKKLIIAVLGYIWLQGVTFGIAPSLSNWVSYDYWEAICAIQWNLFRPGTIIYVVFAFVCCFLGPGIVLVYCYIKILKEVKKQKIQVLAMQPRNGAGKKMEKSLADKWRLVWSLLVVVFAYFIFTTPFSVTKLIKVSVDDKDVIPGPVSLVSALLGYIASAVNPLIYGIFRRDFRNAYKRLIRKICIQKCSNTNFLNSENSTAAKRTNNYISEFDNLTFNNSNANSTVDNKNEEDQESKSQNAETVEQASISHISGTTATSDPTLMNSDKVEDKITCHLLPPIAQRIKPKERKPIMESCSQNMIKHAQYNSIDWQNQSVNNVEKTPSPNKVHVCENGDQQTSINRDDNSSEMSHAPPACTTAICCQTINVMSLESNGKLE